VGTLKKQDDIKATVEEETVSGLRYRIVGILTDPLGYRHWLFIITQSRLTSAVC